MVKQYLQLRTVGAGKGQCGFQGSILRSGAGSKQPNKDYKNSNLKYRFHSSFLSFMFSIFHAERNLRSEGLLLIQSRKIYGYIRILRFAHLLLPQIYFQQFIIVNQTYGIHSFFIRSNTHTLQIIITHKFSHKCSVPIIYHYCIS